MIDPVNKRKTIDFEKFKEWKRRMFKNISRYGLDCNDKIKIEELSLVLGISAKEVIKKAISNYHFQVFKIVFGNEFFKKQFKKIK